MYFVSDGILFLALLVFLIGVDFSSVVVGVIFLWVMCKINLLKELCRSLKIYWFLIAVNAGALIAKVSRINFKGILVI